jgi:L-arabinose isomerase
VTVSEIDALVRICERYDFATDDIAAVRYQAREEIAMEKILVREQAGAYPTRFRIYME